MLTHNSILQLACMYKWLYSYKNITTETMQDSHCISPNRTLFPHPYFRALCILCLLEITWNYAQYNGLSVALCSRVIPFITPEYMYSLCNRHRPSMISMSKKNEIKLWSRVQRPNHSVMRSIFNLSYSAHGLEFCESLMFSFSPCLISGVGVIAWFA